MRITIFFAVIALTPFSLGLVQRPNHTANENLQHEREVEAVFVRFAEAFAKADTIVLESMIANDYIHTNGNTGSVLDKARWLAFVKTRHGDLKSGKIRIDTYHNDEVRIHVYDNTAIITGRNTTIGMREGKIFESQVRFTNIWVKREGRWQRVAFHDSNAALQ